MFKVGERVIDIDYIEEGEGIIRARYRHHYLVAWPKKAGWRQITHQREKDLLPSNSHLIPILLEMERKRNELEEEQDRIDEQIRELIKGGTQSGKDNRTIE